MKFDTTIYEEKMKKSIAALKDELGGIRVGRASIKVLDKIKVPYYGTPTSIDSVASIKTLDAKTLSITPWETSILKDIEKAIQASDLGINPQNDGKVIRLSFPSLTEERRKELTKKVAKIGEESKIALRNVRREANEKSKDQKKKSILSEDEQKVAEKDIQVLTDRFTKEVDKVIEKKNKDIMEI